MNSIFNRQGGWRLFRKQAPVTFYILIANTAFFLFTIVTQGSDTILGYFDFFMYGFHPLHLVDMGAIVPSLVLDGGEYWRIFTAAFLHADFLHFLGNMIIGVLTMGSALEKLVGSKKFSIIYFSSLILAGLAVVLFSSLNIPTIGASGAIFGVLGSLLFITLYRKDLIPQERDMQTIWALSAMNIIFTFLSSGVSVPGHLGGIVSGYLISFFIIKHNSDQQTIKEEYIDPFQDDDEDYWAH